MDDNLKENILKNLIKEYEKTIARIAEKKSLISIIKITKNSKLQKECKALDGICHMIDTSLQFGNYRRALRFLTLLKKIERDILTAEKDIQKNISKYMFS